MKISAWKGLTVMNRRRGWDGLYEIPVPGFDERK